MKKFALAAVAAAALSAGVAQAYTVGTFSNGVVVPNVIHNGTGDTTVVGLVNGSNSTIPVFWTFFDQNSKHVTDGCFPMTGNDFHGFSWAAESGTGLEGKRGYLVFAVGANTAGANADTACKVSTRALATGSYLSANAFHVQMGKSVAFTPVIDGPVTLDPAFTGDLSTLNEDAVLSVGGAARNTETLYMRYYVDGVKDSGKDTRIAVWSVGNQKGSHTVNIYDSAQDRKSVNFVLEEEELSWFDPETIAGRPAHYLDGFIVWDLSQTKPQARIGNKVDKNGVLTYTNNGGVIMSYSVIIDPAFGAVQTLLGAHR